MRVPLKTAKGAVARSKTAPVRLLLAALLPAFLWVWSACEPGPREVRFGEESCEQCRMHISEPGFASQMVNIHGRSRFFDSIECMAAHVLETPDPEQIHSLWVPDFSGSAGWLAAGEAWYLQSETLRSPMGLYLSAFPDRETAGEYLQEYGGQLLSWQDVEALVRREWLDTGSDPHHQPVHGTERR